MTTNSSPPLKSWVVEANCVGEGLRSSFAFSELTQSFLKTVVARADLMDSVFRSRAWLDTADRGFQMPTAMAVRFEAPSQCVTFEGDPQASEGDWVLSVDAATTVLSFESRHDDRTTCAIPVHELLADFESQGEVVVSARAMRLPSLGDVLANALHRPNRENIYHISPTHRAIAASALRECARKLHIDLQGQQAPSPERMSP